MTKIIRIPSELQQDIIDFCHEDNSDKWVHGFDAYKTNSVWNHGRKIIFCHDTKFYEQTKAIEQEYLNAIGLPSDAIIPVGEDDRHPYFPHFIGCIFKDNKKSSGIQTHTDPRKDDWYQMRINYLIQKPVTGGEPIINRSVIDINENQSWNVWASEHKHSALPVTEDKMRITVSFGFYVNPTYVSEVKKRVCNIVDVSVN